MDAINQYLQTTVGNATSNITDVLFQWLIIPSLVFMGLVLAVYTWRTIRRHRVDTAILEIRDTLREMQAASTPPPVPKSDSKTDRKIQ